MQLTTSLTIRGLQFLVSVMRAEGLSENVFKEMTTNQVASTKGKHFGLGFEIYDLGNNEYLCLTEDLIKEYKQ
jgi:hypothetical protein